MRVACIAGVKRGRGGGRAGGSGREEERVPSPSSSRFSPPLALSRLRLQLGVVDSLLLTILIR